jgi:hypothetical protein
MCCKTYQVVFSTELVVKIYVYMGGLCRKPIIINDIISRILRDYTRSSMIIFVMDEDIVRFSMKDTKVFINIHIYLIRITIT